MSLRPHTTFCARCPTLPLLVCVFARAPVSPSLLLHQPLFMFSNCVVQEGGGQRGCPCFVPAGAVIVGTSSWRKVTFYLMRINGRCPITSLHPSLFLSCGHVSFQNAIQNDIQAWDGQTDDVFLLFPVLLFISVIAIILNAWWRLWLSLCDTQRPQHLHDWKPIWEIFLVSFHLKHGKVWAGPHFCSTYVCKILTGLVLLFVV